MANNQNLGIERGKCSFYRNVRVKENVLMHISEFVNLIRNGKWKNEVSSYRQLMFKSDKRSYLVYTPKLAFCGSGTPSQFYRLCPSIENGSFLEYKNHYAN